MEAVKKILLNVDEVEDPPNCLERASALAKFLAAELDLVTILPSFDDIFSVFVDIELRKELQQSLENQTAKSLERLSSDLENSGVSSSWYWKKGAKANKLVKVLVQNDYDLLVKDAENALGGVSTSFDAVDRKLIRQSSCPIWIVVPDSGKNDRPKPVVVAVDAECGTPLEKDLNRRLVEYGKVLAESASAELHVLHVWKFDNGGFLKGTIDSSRYAELYSSAKEAVKGKVQHFLGQMNIELSADKVHLVKGLPSERIVDFCRKNSVDTLVIGSVGRAGLSGILVGNTAERVVHHVACSLLVVSPRQLSSPVEQSIGEDREAESLSL